MVLRAAAAPVLDSAARAEIVGWSAVSDPKTCAVSATARSPSRRPFRTRSRALRLASDTPASAFGNTSGAANRSLTSATATIPTAMAAPRFIPVRNTSWGASTFMTDTIATVYPDSTAP